MTLPAPEPEHPTLNAAQEAAAFVAQIFASDFASPADTPSADTPDADAPDASTQPQPSSAPAYDALPLSLALPHVSQVPIDWPTPAHAGSLRGQRVLILGLGASGLAMARWCVRGGAIVTVADTRDAPPQLCALHAQCPHVRCITGAFDAALVHDGTPHAIYRSPGLSTAAIAPILIAARACQIRVRGELDLYCDALKELRAQYGYAPAVLAVTGTNGKTTVTCLSAQLVAHAGTSVAIAGNIGPTLLDTLRARIDAHELPAVWVLELSSFQLQDAIDFEPTAAAVLNLTQDHLDWHTDMAEYAAAKARIFGPQTQRILNREDPAVMAMLHEQSHGQDHGLAYSTFGYDLPQRPGDWGIECVNGMNWLVRAHSTHDAPSGAPRTRKPRTGAAPAPQPQCYLQRLMPADALRIRGRHNACNALAALALAQAAHCPLAPMLYGLRAYRGEPHRVQPIGIVDGVQYVDDSKGTNVGATVAALTGLGAEQRLVVILGGEGKGQDFSPLRAPLMRCARAVIVIGRDAPRIEAVLHATGLPVQHAIDMEQAVQQAAQYAQAGDAVLMSPACASLDMFRDYAHRAQVFVDAVHALAHERGQSLEGAL